MFKRLIVSILLLVFITQPSFAANLTTSVSVPPRAQDFQTNLTIINNQDTYSPESEINYQITYGSYLSQNYSTTLTATWTQGTIDGDSTPSLDILDYVVGSATNGHGGVSPVIDTVNRKITWTFSSFPANTTDRTVSFKLKTNSSYKNSKRVSFSVTAKTTANDVNKISSLTSYYLYQSSTPTTSTPTPTITITPSLAPQSNSITIIEVRTISNENANIFVQTLKPSKIIINYGTSISLGNSIATSEYLNEQSLPIKNLIANTQYYFRISAIDESGKRIISDIFTFKTASSPPVTLVDLKSIVIVSGNNVIFDSLGRNATSSAQNIILIPQNTSFQFKFSIVDGESVNNLRLIFRKIKGKTVLGTNTLSFTANAASVSLVEIEKGVYSVALSSNIEPGHYLLLATFIDDKGNLNEQEIAVLKITTPFTVLGKDKNPIEGARVFLYFYNETEKRYVPVSSSFFNINNPDFTNTKGVVNFVLPKGKYKAFVSNLGFKDKTIFFEINQSEKSGYPIVYLDRGSIDILTLISYYWRGFDEVFLVNTINYFTSLQNSIRFFDFVALATLLSLALLTLLSFSKRNYIALTSLFSYFLFLIQHKKANNKYITGKIFDEKRNPITFANVYLTNDDEEKIVAVTTTNSKGEFYFRNKYASNFTIMAMKKGYKSTEQLPYSQIDKSVEIVMEKKEHNLNIFEYLFKLPAEILGMSFEVLIVLSLIFEIIFLPYFGIVKTSPFIIISAFNLLLWTLHLRHVHTSTTKI